MKASGKALLSLGLIVAAAVVVTALATRVALGLGGQADVREGGQAGRHPGESMTQRDDLRGFDGIEMVGQWTVVVTQGDKWRVELAHPENGLRDVEVSVRDDKLRLGGEQAGSFFGRGNARLTANVVMPALTTLDTAGANRVTFSGFEGEDLTIKGAGVTNLSGEACRYDKLLLSMAGAGNARLEGIVVKHANVEVAGATNLLLTMDGGELTGALAGAGRIEYFGAVSREAVEVAGFGHIGPAEL